MAWLFAAYMIIWIAIFVVVFSVDRRQKALAAELEQLKTKLGS
jgi:CcmD family protein